jgi:hypothetical protein
MVMILIGLTGLALAWIQHRQTDAVLDIRDHGRLDRDSGCRRALVVVAMRL